MPIVHDVRDVDALQKSTLRFYSVTGGPVMGDTVQLDYWTITVEPLLTTTSK